VPAVDQICEDSYVDPSSYRASDGDRQRVADRLRVALEEGRLNLSEYDERLRDAYAARTYAELDALLVDIPGVAPASQSVVAPATGRPATRWQPGLDGRYPNATRRWIGTQWDSWFRVLGICAVIWAVTSIVNGEVLYFWPGWVAGPWGLLVLFNTVRGLVTDEPQQWAAKEARKDAEREVRKRAKENEKEQGGA
jgi:hypothetical protein